MYPGRIDGEKWLLEPRRKSNGVSGSLLASSLTEFGASAVLVSDSASGGPTNISLGCEMHLPIRIPMLVEWRIAKPQKVSLAIYSVF